MGNRYGEISDRLKAFIEAQKLSFIATVAPEGEGVGD